MLIFGHAGITLGVAVLGGVLIKGNTSAGRDKEKDNNSESQCEPQSSGKFSPGRDSWFGSIAKHIDIRLLLLGSLLPDIIDKPIGIYLFGDVFDNGRIFCHTLLFLVLITLAGLYLYRRHGKNWLLTLSFGVFAHLIFDQMWLQPRTLLWPICGLAFDRAHLESWLLNIFHNLMTEPGVFIPELLGAAILLWFALTLLYKGEVYAFIRYGKIR